MKVIVVEGVMIELTCDQLAMIEKKKYKKQGSQKSFTKILKHFGFIPVKDAPCCYEHIEKNWYAEIQDRGEWSDVWMTGHGLKSINGFPGGYCYNDPMEIETEILKALSSN